MFGSPGLASGEPGRSPVFGTAATVTVTDHPTAAVVAGEWEVPEDRWRSVPVPATAIPANA